MDKKYCEIHHLYYAGDICPFCQSEKYERMSHKYNHKPKKEKKEDTASVGVDNAIAQIVSSEESEEDDLELVAVITAAIAASEGTSADGIVVRSIRKVNNRRK